MRLRSQLVAVPDLTAAQRDAMFALMDRHFDGMRRPAFDADLAEKRWALLLLDPATGALGGFSTQVVLETEVDGRPVQALFSGDTIVAPDRWGESALSGAWGRLALALIDARPGAELYWFLISKGYRTYRFLPLFFHEFYPRHDAETPARVGAVLDALARQKFPAAYDAAAGLVRAGLDQDRLRPALAAVPPERLRDPHVAFFVRRNPDFARGDELCCLAPLTRANFTPAAYRVIAAEAPA